MVFCGAPAIEAHLVTSGCEQIRWQTFRCSLASLLVAMKQHPTVAQERLRHANPRNYDGTLRAGRPGREACSAEAHLRALRDHREEGEGQPAAVLSDTKSSSKRGALFIFRLQREGDGAIPSCALSCWESSHFCGCTNRLVLRSLEMVDSRGLERLSSTASIWQV